MSKVVLDATALLALLNQEHGYNIVEKLLPNAIMSAVNASEVIAVLMTIGISDEEAENITDEVIKEIIPFDQKQAFIAASLRKKTKTLGLSFGDRACLALAKLHNLPVLTADKAWSKLKEDIRVEVIR